MNQDTQIDLTTALQDFTLESIHIPTTTKDPKDLKLMYVVHVFYKEKLIITSEYSMGIAHIPGYAHFGVSGPRSIHDDQMLSQILRTGKGSIEKVGKLTQLSLVQTPIVPNLEDVMYCLVMDSNAADYLNFEDWAGDLGYDKDSRKAETIFNACRKVGDTLRINLGHDKLQELRDAFQDY